MHKKVLLILFLLGIYFSPFFSSITAHADTITSVSVIYDEMAGGGGGGGGSAGLGKGSGGQALKGGHQKNVRPSTKQKHEKADARRQKEQKKAEEKREKNKKK